MHSMTEYDESEFARDFLWAYVISKRARSGVFYYRGDPYCWGAFREYGKPPDGCLVLELVNPESGEAEEFRVWYGVEVAKGRIQRARHVRFDELIEIKMAFAN
jgi:hypothetical protein